MCWSHCFCSLTALLTLAIVFPDAASAQLTAKDIEDLQEQGRREGWTFTVGENPATKYALERLCGLVVPDNWWEGARFDPSPPRYGLPERFDWRELGGCTPIKNQGSCGSCWAFGTVGPLESNILIRDGVEEDLSEQWLVSCNRDGWGCHGGWWAHDYHQWKTDPCGGTGAVLEVDFPYVASDVPCNCPYPHEFLIDDWAYIGNDHSIPPVDAIKQAILDYGPVSVAVYVNSAFHGYTGGIFNGCQSGTVNHAVVLVGWDDNQGPSGIWFLRNSWGPGWGEDGYMRIPYGCSEVGYSGNYIDYPGTLPTIGFQYPDGRPELLQPNQPTTFRVNVVPDTGVPVPGTGWIHYSLNGGDFVVDAMTEISPNEYEATLPAADCFDRYDWYVSAEEQTAGRVCDPPHAPTVTYSALVATDQVVIFEDDCEADRGWTVQNSEVTEGAWERAVPSGNGGGRGDPPSDYDGSGRCYVTGNGRDEDLDGGPTQLLSPTLDLSGDAVYEISYARWFVSYNGDTDQMRVKVSNDNGNSWVNVETVQNSGVWVVHSFNVADYVTPTAQVRVRFGLSDNPNDSVTEAGVDAFTVRAFVCEQAEQTALPEEYTIVVGQHVSGSLEDLFESDDARLVLTHSGFFPPWIELEVKGTTPIASPGVLQFVFEGHPTAEQVEQRIKMYDYAAGDWEEVDVREMPTTDEVIEIVISDNPSRFIDPGTLEMKTRIRWMGISFLNLYGWNAEIDQTVWTVTP